jgi:hypothetical protein
MLKRKPAHNLTQHQQNQAKRLAGTMPIQDIVKKMGVSRTNLQRFGRDEKISFNYFNQHKKNPDRVTEICDYYVKYGLTKTQKKYSNIKIRSIIEHYSHEPLQIRWTNKQRIELARMAGLISLDAQARYFDRPGANAGSIKSYWSKNQGHGQRNINGIPHWIAKHFVKNSCPFVETKFGSSKKNTKRLVLWVDLRKNLLPGAPFWLKKAMSTMSTYQAWLWDCKEKYVHKKVIRMISEREMLETNKCKTLKKRKIS